jgi:hypothetical protein
MLGASYRAFMANIQVKNIPEGLHNKLGRYAREHEVTIGEIVLEAIEREVARREWHKRFASDRRFAVVPRAETRNLD